MSHSPPDRLLICRTLFESGNVTGTERTALGVCFNPEQGIPNTVAEPPESRREQHFSLRKVTLCIASGRDPGRTAASATKLRM
jgi:hypothetical protein